MDRGERKKKQGIKNHNYLTFNTLSFERDTGIEPASQAWEARALPMC